MNQNWGKASVPAIIEGVSQMMLFVGIVLSCAQLKAIIYCSGTVWSAVLAWLFLQKKLSPWQIAGMGTVLKQELSTFLRTPMESIDSYWRKSKSTRLVIRFQSGLPPLPGNINPPYARSHSRVPTSDRAPENKSPETGFAQRETDDSQKTDPEVQARMQ